MKENNDIEHWMQETFQHEAATPPAAAWSKIKSRLDSAAQPPAATHSAAHGTAAAGPRQPQHHLRRLAWAVAAVVAAAAVALLIWLPSRQQPSLSATTHGTLPNAARHNGAPSPATTQTAIATAQPSALPSAQSVAPTTTATATAIAPCCTAAPAAKATKANTLSSNAAASNAAPPAAEPRAALQTAATPLPAKAPAAPRSTVPTATTAPTDAGAAVSQPTQSLAQPAAEPLSIPNLVTPNGDGINDYWVLHGLEEAADVQVSIFSSNGKQVYISRHYHGEFSGSDLPDGNYYFLLKVKSANVSRRGVLVIKR